LQFNKFITYKQFGNQAVLIAWPVKIDEVILADILQFKTKIHIAFQGEIQDLIVGYNSLTLIFKEDIIDFNSIKEKLQQLYHQATNVTPQENYIWEIPVCYDVTFGIDLKEMSTNLRLSEQEIIHIHSSTLYTVFFIGFLPGFLYLGGLDKRLHFDRKPNPRLNVAKGTVAIGGKQTGIYPQQSAGGWNCIGKTPISFFDINKELPCFAKAGDKIKFTPISKKEFDAISAKVVHRKFKLIKSVIHA